MKKKIEFTGDELKKIQDYFLDLKRRNDQGINNKNKLRKENKLKNDVENYKFLVRFLREDFAETFKKKGFNKGTNGSFQPPFGVKKTKSINFYQPLKILRAESDMLEDLLPRAPSAGEIFFDTKVLPYLKENNLLENYSEKIEKKSIFNWSLDSESRKEKITLNQISIPSRVLKETLKVITVELWKILNNLSEKLPTSPRYGLSGDNYLVGNSFRESDLINQESGQQQPLQEQEMESPNLNAPELASSMIKLKVDTQNEDEQVLTFRLM